MNIGGLNRDIYLLNEKKHGSSNNRCLFIYQITMSPVKVLGGSVEYFTNTRPILGNFFGKPRQEGSRYAKMPMIISEL